jgi:hypothetical protein
MIRVEWWGQPVVPGAIGPVLIAALLFLSAAPVGHAGPVGAGAPTVLAPRGTAPVTPPPIPTPGCSGTNSNFSVAFAPAGVLANATDPTSGWYDGAAPLDYSANLTILGFPTLYTYDVDWGDMTNHSRGTVNKTTNGALTLPFTHVYLLPALVQANAYVSYSCQDGRSGGQGTGWLLDVYGPAGPDPIDVTANVTNGTVPMDVNFTAVIAGAPANSTAKWVFFVPDGPLLQQSSTSSNLTQSWLDLVLNAPGYAGGYIQVFYPVTSLLYAEVGLPGINVAPLAVVNVAHTPLVGYAPWNVTFWANATNVTGGRVPGNTSVQWSFQDPQGSGLFAEGPTNGSTVWREYWLNYSGSASEASATANLVRSDGVILGYQAVYFPVADPVASLAFRATPSSGPTPLSFALTALLLSGPPVPNGSTPFYLTVEAFGPGSSPAWSATDENWNGSTTSIPGNLSAVGTYLVLADAYWREPTGPQLLATANVSIVVSTPPVPSLSPPTASRTSADVGQPVTFSTSVSGPAGLDSIAWTGLPSSCPSTNSTSIVCRATSPGQMSVAAQLTYSVGASVVSSPATVQVSADPTVSAPASSISPELAGDNVTFTVSSAAGSGGDSYTWHGLWAGCSAVLPSSVSVQCVTIVGNYSIWVAVVDSNGFQSNGTALNFTVETSPVVHFPPPTAHPTASSLDVWPYVGLGAAVLVAALALLLLYRRRDRAPPGAG